MADANKTTPAKGDSHPTLPNMIYTGEVDENGRNMLVPRQGWTWKAPGSASMDLVQIKPDANKTAPEDLSDFFDFSPDANATKKEPE
jgi:hypothetical protein